MSNYIRLTISAILSLLFIFLQPVTGIFTDSPGSFMGFIIEQNQIFIIIFLSWAMIEVIKLVKKLFLRRFDISKEDNLSSRKVYTQVNILEKVLIFLIILIAVGLVLLSFDSIRKIGITLFASAGVAGIILGLSAQKVVGALLAGIQIAITQPFRIDDAVLVEGEWGWIEEINLTYVVVRIWDKRRLVLPSTYFIEKPFQNWTRTSAELIGSIYLYTDYMIPLDKLRAELTRLLESSELWDGKVNVLQVTDTKETSVELRILVSARNSPQTWDLRVFIREKMIEFIRDNYPESLPRTRVNIDKNA